jgi:hypothetical protein
MPGTIRSHVRSHKDVKIMTGLTLFLRFMLRINNIETEVRVLNSGINPR